MEEAYRARFGESPHIDVQATRAEKRIPEAASAKKRSSGMPTMPLCRYWAQGHCKDGKACHFRHEIDLVSPLLCEDWPDSSSKCAGTGDPCGTKHELDPANAHGKAAEEPEHEHPQLVCENQVTTGYCLKGSPYKARHTFHNDDRAKSATRQYSEIDLQTIGKSCSMQLPPASAVQAMFMYELQRQTEVEKLFHVCTKAIHHPSSMTLNMQQAQMLRMARTDDVSHDTLARILQLEKEMKAIKQHVTVKEVQESLATNNARHEQQAAKIEECTAKLNANTERTKQIFQALETLKATPPVIDQSATEEVTAKVIALDGDITTLFNERDPLIEMLSESTSRISKLEDLVRLLTVQLSLGRGNSSALSDTSTPPTQQLPVKNAGREAISLAVPKGSSFRGKNENRVPSGAIKGRTPGMQWAG
ncbi:hypothetical protein LTR62_007153 [Meristemomyces frigidus]|uniref:C3H1-type domain-containing protein n=1 Tax=Meristemomyces frigidus TaxID=1508187 RepID=A0AAN7TC36_9PEZI|nr:hypothetical protein LTR62_007153 [Meristemomyces frigidus]